MSVFLPLNVLLMVSIGITLEHKKTIKRGLTQSEIALGQDDMSFA